MFRVDVSGCVTLTISNLILVLLPNSSIVSTTDVVVSADNMSIRTVVPNRPSTILTGCVMRDAAVHFMHAARTWKHIEGSQLTSCIYTGRQRRDTNVWYKLESQMESAICKFMDELW